MLYNLNWLATGKTFPPTEETSRIQRYADNEKYFASEHIEAMSGSVYYEYIKRITRVVGNFNDFISFPVLFGYQRLMALKTADLVCGEYPIITSGDKTHDRVREAINFDAKMYGTVIDLCRFGDCIWRIYKTDDGSYTYTIWDIKDWYPIVSQDGTLTIEKHVLAWIETLENEKTLLHVQIHSVGEYEKRVYNLDTPVTYINERRVFVTRNIGKQIGKSEIIKTGLNTNAVIHIRNMYTSNTIYGYDDYTPIDSLVAEIMTRTAQISKILDKHADPNMTGPASMLRRNKETNELYFEAGDFYAVNPGEEQPKYLTWEGELESSFKQLELLINQLYILSELGSAILGAGGSESGQAISGAAMRFKMTNPLAKARRLSNLLTSPVKTLFSIIEKINIEDFTVIWQDGLPDDPKETLELVRLATGKKAIMPLEKAIIEYLKRTPKEAQEWVSKIELEEIKNMQPNKNNSKDGMNNFGRKSVFGSEDNQSNMT